MSETAIRQERGANLTRLYRVVIRDWLNFQLLLSILLIGVGVLCGFLSDSPYEIQIVIFTVLFAAVGVGWVIAGGLAGQLLIGYISFFGVGAYVNALLYTKFGVSPWFNLWLAAGAGGFVAFLAASISVRFGLNEDYFGLFTVALTQVFKVIFINWSFAGKATGISISVLETDFLAMSFLDKASYLYIASGLLLGAVLLSYLVQRSRLGYYFSAVRESPQAAEALGVNVTHYKILAIVLSGAVAGSLGAFFSQFTTFIDPERVFGLALNFELLLPPVLGGRLSLVGPLLGAILLRPVKDLLRGALGGEADALYLVIYGVVLIVCILLMPRGIAGYLERLHARWLAPTDADR